MVFRVLFRKLSNIRIPEYSMEELFNSRVYMGHKKELIHQDMVPYLYGDRVGMHIIDLDHTVSHLKRALEVTYEIALRQGIILFLCRYPQFVHKVEKAAIDAGVYAHCRLWARGNFLNANKFYARNDLSVNQLLLESPELRNADETAKLVVLQEEEIRLPDLCIFFHSQDTLQRQHAAIRDCAISNIPSIALVDTNCSTEYITYPIPANDDTHCSVEYFINLFVQTIKNAKEDAKNSEHEMQIPSFTPKFDVSNASQTIHFDNDQDDNYEPKKMKIE